MSKLNAFRRPATREQVAAGKSLARTSLTAKERKPQANLGLKGNQFERAV